LTASEIIAKPVALAGNRGLPGSVFGYGFSPRKRAIVRRFVANDMVRFVSNGKLLQTGSSLLVWGSGPLPKHCPADIHVVRLEDGFLRSVGLGADLIRPISWVIDHRGIYYDATRPSSLEHLLQTGGFPRALLERGACLRQRIVDSSLTKYNVGSGAWPRPSSAARVVLVPGQVESDASIRYGAPGIRTNLELLQAVRKANPEAYVIYKPHPDVVAGLRAKGQAEDKAYEWCDEVVADAGMGDLLPAVDEVHVLTSLTGFEALMRGKQVVCYGQPFYSGWGLTTDIVPHMRRTRRLSMEELVAGTLILYPTYVSRISGLFITPEQALDELLSWRASAFNNMSLSRKVLRKVLQFWKGQQ
jgi:capsular polysaccharide export protein